MEKKIKYMYLLCRETISEEINCGFIDNYITPSNFISKVIIVKYNKINSIWYFMLIAD
jgi:hypothetical protein